MTFWETAAECTWGRYLTTAEARVLANALDLAPGTGQAMEVGCDGGRWSKVVIERRGSVVCTDVDRDRLELCGRRLPEADCILTLVTDEQLPTAEADLSLLLVYEVAPVTDAPWFPAEARRAVQPGGILVLSYFNPVSIRAVLNRMVAALDRRRRARSFYRGPSYRTFRRSLVEAGFELVHQEGLAWAPFTRCSNSRWVSLAARVEHALGLRHLAAISPWVLVIARRMEDAPRA